MIRSWPTVLLQTRRSSCHPVNSVRTLKETQTAEYALLRPFFIHHRTPVYTRSSKPVFHVKFSASSAIRRPTCANAHSSSSSSSSSSPISSSVYLPGCALKLARSSHLFLVLSWYFFLKSAIASSRVVGPFSALAPASPYTFSIACIQNIDRLQSTDDSKINVINNYTNNTVGSSYSRKNEPKTEYYQHVRNTFNARLTTTQINTTTVGTELLFCSHFVFAGTSNSGGELKNFVEFNVHIPLLMATSIFALGLQKIRQSSPQYE